MGCWGGNGLVNGQVGRLASQATEMVGKLPRPTWKSLGELIFFGISIQQRYSHTLGPKKSWHTWTITFKNYTKSVCVKFFPNALDPFSVIGPPFVFFQAELASLEMRCGQLISSEMLTLTMELEAERQTPCRGLGWIDRRSWEVELLPSTLWKARR